MKSKKSFCNISAVLVARNLKQFWLLPFAGFLAYFIGDILPLLKFDIPKAKLYEQIYSQALHLSWWYIAACAIIPICASVAVFASMHNSANATVLHSQPFSRKKLFRSNVLSGWLLTIIPVLLMGLGFVIFVNISNFYSLTELFSVKISVTLITVTYVYAVSVLAAMVAGTVVTHFLLCMFFNGVLPVTIYLVNKYLLTFLFGFSSPKFASTYFSPITWLNNSYMTDYNFYYFRVYLIYFILSLAIIWIAGRIYRKLPLEKEGVSVIFKWPGEIICYLFAFIGMTALAFLMRSLADGKQAVFFLGAFIGSILSYIIARMILEKTIFIFKKSFIIKYGIFVIASLLFFSVTIFDVTGYQTKVPKVEEIKEVYLEDSFGCREKALSNPQTLEKITDFHKTVIKYAADDESAPALCTFYITYITEDDKRISRRYSLALEEHKEIYDAYEAVFNDAEYRQVNDKITFPSIGSASIRQVYAEEGVENNKDIPLPFDMLDDLHACISADRKKLALAEAVKYVNNPSSNYNLELVFSSKSQNEQDDRYNDFIDLRPSDKKTLALLQSRGYGKYFLYD